MRVVDVESSLQAWLDRLSIAGRLGWPGCIPSGEIWIKFGADKVFRSKDSTVTDDDIDKILEEGKKRTAEMTEKMQLAEKGDMYDFKLDGGMSNQVFEGTDYSDTKNQKAFSTDQPFFLDTGKRERKEVSYSETLNPIIVNQDYQENQKLDLNYHVICVYLRWMNGNFFNVNVFMNYIIKSWNNGRR